MLLLLSENTPKKLRVVFLIQSYFSYICLSTLFEVEVEKAIGPSANDTRPKSKSPLDTG